MHNTSTAYKLHTTQVSELIAATNPYPLIIFDLRVDGTGFVIIKYRERQYYQRIFTYDEMKKPAGEMAAFIISLVENYFNNN